MDNLHNRLNFDRGLKNKIFHHSLRGHLKITKTARFGYEMLLNTENRAPRSLHDLYFFILRAEVTIFTTKIVTISRTIQTYILHFATKLCNYTTFKMLFLAAVKDLPSLLYKLPIQLVLYPVVVFKSVILSVLRLNRSLTFARRKKRRQLRQCDQA